MQLLRDNRVDRQRKGVFEERYSNTISIIPKNEEKGDEKK
jgi:hypothetical protein